MADRRRLTALLGDLVRGDRELAGMLSLDELESVLEDGILRSVRPGARISGGGAGSVFLVLHGRLREIGLDAENGLGPGDLVGTVGLLESDLEAATACAETPAILVQIPREVAGRVLERVPRLVQRLLARCRQTITERALAAVPVLSALDSGALRELAARATLTGHREGSDVVRSGDIGDTFHVVAEGLAAVRHVIDGHPINLALIRAGDYFGEWSLLTGAPRAATVTAIARTTTVGIDRESFLDLVQEYPEIQQRIDSEARNRYDRSAAFLARVESAHDVRDTLRAIETIVDDRG